jgi:hypothetical protein
MNSFKEDMEGDFRMRHFRHVDDDLIDEIGNLLKNPASAKLYCVYEDDQKVDWIQQQLNRMDSK